VDASVIPQRRRWLAFYVLCVAMLMIVLDLTIVSVALPSIRADLGFSTTSLAWVVNAYLLAFTGCLLLAGRLGDLYGHRRLFLAGIGLFTAASLACGLAETQAMLIGARAVQGVGGAIGMAIPLSLTVLLFPDPGERAKAIGIAGVIASAGAAVGVLIGGVLTGALDWHWIFLVNVPIGALLLGLTLRLLPADHGRATREPLDLVGAVAVTAAVVLAVYAIVNADQAGWSSAQTVGLLAGSVLLIVGFVLHEQRTPSPLVPFGIFRLRSVAASNAIAVFSAAAEFGWFFTLALYMQLVLDYDPLEVGLGFLPACVIMALLSGGFSARLVLRYGFRTPLALALLSTTAGMAIFLRTPVDGSFVVDVLPSMILLGIGSGISWNVLTLAAMDGVAPSEAGLASGVINTSFMIGGALGIAVFASVAVTHSSESSEPSALLDGYHAAFLAGVFISLAATLLTALLLRRQAGRLQEPEPAPVLGR
jgi:EmrB/QacA subfamily drug resistance transporter